VQAQVLIGGFQGLSDPTDYGWTENGTSITNNLNCSFAAAGVPGFADSLVIGGAGTFGNPSSLQISLSAAQIQQFLNNSWLTFTFSIPTSAATGGYNQIYNVQFQFSGAGYGSGSTNWMSGGNAAGTWGTLSMAEGSTNSNQNGEPNYYLYSGYPMMSQTVTFNYTGSTNAFITSGSGYLNILFQGNTGNGSVATQIWNSVVFSQGPFGAALEAPPGEFVVDDFNANGVGPENPTNDDYYSLASGDSTNIYSQGQITNVYGNWYSQASGVTNFVWNTNQLTAPGVKGVNGSLELDINWENQATAGAGVDSQWLIWEQGPNNNEYNMLGVSSLTYTSLEMDVKWDPSSASYLGAQTYSNYGPLRIGIRDSSYGSDWQNLTTGTTITNIPLGNTNWVHLIAPLSAANPNLNGSSATIQGILIGADNTSYANGQFNGPGTLYVDNIVFKSPTAGAVKIPPPTLSIQPVTPGLRVYAGSVVNTYDRDVLTTVDQNQSWIGGAGTTVTYAFSLLSYPNNNIDQTMLELIPVTSGNATVNNEYVDYGAPNGLWLVLAPFGGGQVTATVEWKTNLASANPANGPANIPASNPNAIALLITNSTAIGTWLLTFNSATTGTLTPPGGTAHSFTITDPTAVTDFANPVIAQFGLQPNSSAGEGLYETWGYIGVTNVLDGKEYEDFTHESSDLNLNEVTGYQTTPSGFFQNVNSANVGGTIIIRTNADLYMVSWTTPAVGYNLVEDTNLLLVPASHWVTPDYYSSGNDDIAPRGTAELEGPNEVEVIPADNAATVNGQLGGPLAPDAYFILTTNTPASAP
jgi:hypothetical protein